MDVLIVDDSRTMRMMVKRALRQAGIDAGEAREAGDGREALTQIQARMPDLILSDWNMPDMDGLQLLQVVRLTNPRVPFGFITSQANEESRLAAVSAGANFLIGKPFTPEVLRDAVADVLRGR